MKNFEKATTSSVNLVDSEVSFLLNSKIYPKDVIFKACYSRIDTIYIFLDSPGKGQIAVYLKTKERSTRKQLEELRGDFLNELLNASLRHEVSQRNQKIVEHIVGGAINAALAKEENPLLKKGESQDKDMQEIEQEIAKLRKELDVDFEDAYTDDPLKIQKPKR